MELKEGKNIEKLLAGTVDNPVTEARFRKDVAAVGGIKVYRKKLEPVLDQVMDRVRSHQTEKDVTSPKSRFAFNLLNDLDLELGDITEIDEGERYELRFYSAVDTILDYAGGLDCWVELFDKKKQTVLGRYTIDLKTNPNEIYSGFFGDGIFYFNMKYLDESAKGKINKALFRDREYQAFVKNVAGILRERVKIGSVLE